MTGDHTRTAGEARAEEVADGSDILRVDVPDSLAAADGVEGVDVGADESCGVLALELCDRDLADVASRDVCTWRLAQMHRAVGQVGERTESSHEVIFPTRQRDLWVGRQWACVDGRDEDARALLVRRWDAIVGPGSERSPHA